MVDNILFRCYTQFRCRRNKKKRQQDEPWQMNSNAALKIPEVPRKREAGKKKPERKKAGRKKRRAEGRFRGNSKDRKTVEKTTGPKKTVKPAEGSLQLKGQT